MPAGTLYYTLNCNNFYNGMIIQETPHWLQSAGVFLFNLIKAYYNEI